VSADAHGCNKQAYPTHAAAIEALDHHGEKYPTSGKNRLRAYPCDRCPAWHLTSKYSGKKLPVWEKDPSWERPDAKTT
jgi:hypothetical protein